jgi:hypothetical protein
MNWGITRWKEEPLNPKPFSPVHSARKFSEGAFHGEAEGRRGEKGVSVGFDGATIATRRAATIEVSRLVARLEDSPEAAVGPTVG